MSEVSEARAVVRRLEDGAVWVEIEQEGCGRCHEAGGCGGQKLTQAFCAGPRSFRIEHAGGLQVGDRVRLGLPAREIRRGANLAYVIPLVLMLAGAALGLFVAADLGAIVGGALGLALGWWNLRRLGKSGLADPALRPYFLP